MKTTIRVLLVVTSTCALSCRDADNPRYPVLPAEVHEDEFITSTHAFTIGSTMYQADFGTIAVRENRNRPASRLITLPFLRIHSASADPAEPVFGLAGGPGQSNVSWDWGKASTFLSRRDFVVVGYRGVDGSTVLACPEVAKAVKRCDNPLSRESMQMIGHAWRVGAERMKSEGVDLDGYSMLETIEDMESVRKGLGYKEIDLLSESYGTRIAYLYGLRHPETIRRSAMISVNPPGHFVWNAPTIDSQLKHYAVLWARDTVTAKMSQDLYATMRNVLRAMPARWLLFPIDPGKVRVVTFALLFQRATAARVFDAYGAAEQGDPSGLALMSLAYDHVVPSLFTWGDLASKAVSADFEPARDYFTEMDTSGFPLGSPMGKLLWGPLSFSPWPMNLLPKEFRRVQESDVETLLLSGSVDFSTPAEFATNELLPHLSRGSQVVLSEYGHVGDMWYVNPDNTRQILRSFYDTGIPDVSMNRYIPMTFQVEWGFPLIAKIGVSAIVLVVIGFIGGIAWMIRRHLKRKQPAVVGNHAGVS